jgi:XTP/dITP diphosphohydrolase
LNEFWINSVAMKILIATRNEGKLSEIRSAVISPGVEWVTLNDIPSAPEVEEDGDSFVINAVKKAVTLALTSRLWTLADDSGLEVDALDGRPGVRSARYAGEPVNHQNNMDKLLQELKGRENRSACFVTVLALSSPSGRSQIVEGRCEGVIATSPRGSGGFGYDPIFMPQKDSRTFAEMSAHEKNQISHRAVALRKAAETWKPCFDSEGRLWA